MLAIKYRFSGCFHTPDFLSIEWIIEDVLNGVRLIHTHETIFDLLMAGF